MHRIAALLALATVLSATANPTPPGLPGLRAEAYLSAVNDLRSRALALEEARGRRDAASSEAKRDRELLLMYEQLFQKRAVSAEELSGARLRRDVSVQSERRFDALVDYLEAIRDQAQQFIDAILGKPVPLEKVHALHLRGWKAQCRERTEALVEAQARVRYAEHLYAIARRLVSTKAISREEYLQRETGAHVAAAHLEAARRGEHACDKELPTPLLKDLPR